MKPKRSPQWQLFTSEILNHFTIKMQSNCNQNAIKNMWKCNQNVIKMHQIMTSKCNQNSIKRIIEKTKKPRNFSGYFFWWIKISSKYHQSNHQLWIKITSNVINLTWNKKWLILSDYFELVFCAWKPAQNND